MLSSNNFYSEQQQGWTALQRVCLYNLTRYPSAKYEVSERRGEIAKLLIDHGTDIKKIDSVGHCTSMHCTHLVIALYRAIILNDFKEKKDRFNFE